MRTLKKEESKKEKKSFVKSGKLSKSELHFIRGSDEQNKENGGDQ